jgi:hypothetical protein
MADASIKIVTFGCSAIVRRNLVELNMTPFGDRLAAGDGRFLPVSSKKNHACSAFSRHGSYTIQDFLGCYVV